MATEREVQSLAAELVELGTTIGVAAADGKLSLGEAVAVLNKAIDVVHASLPHIAPRPQRMLNRAKRKEAKARELLDEVKRLRELAATLD